MIPRYSRPAMTAIWTETAKLDLWLEIEILACEGMANIGAIPKKDAVTIRQKADYNLKRVQKNEERTQHDVLAFLEDVATYVGPAGRWIHQGLTSSDLLDTTLAVQCCRAADILLEDLKQLRKVIGQKARKYKFVPQIGRSHGIHAEPITYGLKLALMYEEFGRSIERLKEARAQIAVGKLSGAVGTHAHLDPRVEAYVCKKLGLKPANLATQVVQRDRHAHFMTTLALVATSIDRWATEFRHLQRTEVLEVEEFFAKGQKGSSAMPHKRNPIIGERLSGLARVLRGNALAAMENVPLWHERDISHSSAERIILPDSTVLLDYMLAKLITLVEKQQVYPANMKRNLEITKGLYHSGTLLLALTDRGLPRRTAYEMVQRSAMACWQSSGTKPFIEFLLEDKELTKLIKPAELKKLCSLDHHFRHVQSTFKKCGL